jgi:hypothetical protein
VCVGWREADAARLLQVAVSNNDALLVLAQGIRTCISAFGWQQLPCRHRPAAAAQGLQSHKGLRPACFMDAEVVQQPQLAFAVATCGEAGAWQQRCSAGVLCRAYGHAACHKSSKQHMSTN